MFWKLELILSSVHSYSHLFGAAFNAEVDLYVRVRFTSTRNFGRSSIFACKYLEIIVI